MTTVLSPTAAPERIPADEWQAQLELAATFRLLAKLGWVNRRRGEPAVTHLMRQMLAEVDLALALSGHRSVADLGPESVVETS